MSPPCFALLQGREILRCGSLQSKQSFHSAALYGLSIPCGGPLRCRRTAFVACSRANLDPIRHSFGLSLLQYWGMYAARSVGGSGLHLAVRYTLIDQSKGLSLFASDFQYFG